MTREEHIENLKVIASDMPSDKCSDWIESLMAGVKALEQEPSSSEKPNKWILVSEGLPETTDYYLVTVRINEYGLMIPSVRTALYNAETKDFTIHTGTNMCIVGDVVAWRDCLPEPYKSEIPTGAERGDKG